MKAYSILFDSLEPTSQLHDRFSPELLQDIQIDQVIKQIIKGREAYELEPFFVHKLPNQAAIKYRTDVMREIDQAGLLDALRRFSQQMLNVRTLTRHGESTHDQEQQWKWQLDSAFYYCRATLDLNEHLQAAAPQSTGLKRFSAWLNEYVESEAFKQLQADAFQLRAAFAQISYSLFVENGKMTVQPNEIDKNYCQQLYSVFGRGAEGADDDSGDADEPLDFSFQLFSGTQLSGLELNILNVVKKLYPEPFRALKSFAAKHQQIVDPSLTMFEREIQFYLACLEFFHSLRKAGLPYSYATVSAQKQIRIRSGYDVALAAMDRPAAQSIVDNDLHLQPEERICVVTGPNQGGKTTFARMIGQILTLSAIGCPVPCEAAELFAFDQLFTHFPAKEQVGRDTGQLKAELLRLKQILTHATANSVVILNELFSTTATLDAYAMGKRTLETFLSKGALSFYVTHIYELADAFDGIVSLAATTDPDEPGRRTFKMVRKMADGQVYASTLVEKYGLTKAQMKERIRS